MIERSDTPRSVIIIGAGIAGLSAGCYAQMNGLRSQIFELHRIPGGLCTSWRHRGYLFDGSIRLLGGTSPASSTYPLWQELGMMEGRQVHYYDEFVRFEGRDGRSLILYTNIERLEQHMLELSPVDEDVIHDLARALRQFTRMELPVDMTPSDPLEFMQLGQEMLPMLWPTLRWLKVTVSDFAERFQDPLLREALPHFFQFSRPDFPMMLLLSSIAMMNDREMGYPIGGSLKFAEDLAQRYLDLGGQIHYRSRVEEIVVQESLAPRGEGMARAVGVRLADGSVHHADIVISAADGRSTIFRMLHGLYADDTIRSYYADLPVCQSIVQISLGVAADWSCEPPMVSFPLPQPIELGNVKLDRLVLKQYSFDPTMAPPGKSVLTLWCAADYAYWHNLRADREAYKAAKDQVAARVIQALEERYPGFAATVEEVDVATPVTYERYTGNWQGAFAGWAMTTRKMSMMVGHPMSKTLPGLDRFYMIGQWVEPGGNVELSAASGRDVIKDICRAEGLDFRTSVSTAKLGPARERS